MNFKYNEYDDDGHEADRRMHAAKYDALWEKEENTCNNCHRYALCLKTKNEVCERWSQVNSNSKPFCNNGRV